jgi:DNA polymerase-3 subunit delta'
MWKTIGQDIVIRVLKNSIAAGNMSHAYLIVGPPHIGKATFALDIARYVNCVEEEAPCDVCRSCRRINSGKHVDINVLSLESPLASPENGRSRKEISIKDIEELQKRASLSAYEGKYRIFIIDGVENLSEEAANRLLKTLEEPPSNVIFLMLAADEKRVLTTIQSRCQKIEMEPAAPGIIEQHLIEHYGAEPDKARLYARLARGCPGTAITLMDNVKQIQVRTDILHQLQYLLSAGCEQRFAFVEHLGTDRGKNTDMLDTWLTWWRDVLLTKCDCTSSITNVDFAEDINRAAEILSIAEIKESIDRINEAKIQIDQNANTRLVLEVLMLDLPRKSVRMTGLKTAAGAG